MDRRTSRENKSKMFNKSANEKQNRENTTNALLEQLIYIDNFMNRPSGNEISLTPNMDMDAQLSLDLAAFADDSFVFPDDEKHDFDDINEDINNEGSSNRLSNTGERSENQFKIKNDDKQVLNIGELPRWPVPPGAKLSLESAGLSQGQIDLLAALVAQHQKEIHSNEPINDTESPFAFSNGKMPFSNSETDDDRRRRNTAASARFRIKKKLKEKQMETRIVNLGSTIKDLEIQIQQLELENKLLKSLVIEKGTQKSEEELRFLKDRAKN